MNGNDDASLPDTTPEQEIGALVAAYAKGNKDLEKDIELSYQPIDLVADSTVSGYASGLKSIDFFCGLTCKKKMSEYETVDFDDPKVCAAIIFDFKCYCSFLLVAQSNKGKHYMPRSQKQMLSNAFNCLHKAHLAVRMFDQENYPVETKWYVDIQKSLQRDGFNNAVERGESVGDKAAGIRQKLLEDINRNLIKEGRYKEASAVCTLYHAVGRGGEVSTMTFSSMKWDSTLESLWAGWAEVKTAHYTDLSFFANTLSYGYLTCFMWTFGAYIIMAAEAGHLRSRPHTPDFVYPDYQEKRSSAAATVTKAIASLVGKVAGLLKAHTSHGLRVGATDDMLFNIFCHIACAIARGAWDCRGMCMILSYYTKNLFVSIAGKALAGVKDCRQHHSMPTLDALPDVARDKVNHMAESLFLWGPDVFRADCNGHLLPARDALLATQLMWFKIVVLEHGQELSLIKMLVEKAAIAGITFEELEEYSTLIRERYQADMIKNQQNTGSCLESLRESIKTLTNMLVHQVGKLHAVIANLTGEVHAANAKLDAQDSKIENLQQQNAMLTSTVSNMQQQHTMENARIMSTMIDMRDMIVRFMMGGIVNDETVHTPATNTAMSASAKRGRVSLDADADGSVGMGDSPPPCVRISATSTTANNDMIIDLSKDDSEGKDNSESKDSSGSKDDIEQQQPRTKMQKVSNTKQQATISSFFLPMATTSARPTATATTTAAHPIATATMTAARPIATATTTAARPGAATATTTAARPIATATTTAARPIATATTTAARPGAATAASAAHPASTSTASRPASTSTFGLDWKDSMAGYLTQFLINSSMYSFWAFCDSKELGNLPTKQVKNKLKDILTFAWSLANDKQREIMSRPRVDEANQANRYEYPAYVKTLSTVCDKLASAVFQVAIIDNPLPPPPRPPPPVNPYQKNGKKMTRAPVNKAPTHYKHLKVSYAYNRIQRMKKHLTVAAAPATVVVMEAMPAVEEEEEEEDEQEEVEE
jgi:hypothetical protein